MPTCCLQSWPICPPPPALPSSRPPVEPHASSGGSIWRQPQPGPTLGSYGSSTERTRRCCGAACVGIWCETRLPQGDGQGPASLCRGRLRDRFVCFFLVMMIPWAMVLKLFFSFCLSVSVCCRRESPIVLPGYRHCIITGLLVKSTSIRTLDNPNPRRGANMICEVTEKSERK